MPVAKKTETETENNVDTELPVLRFDKPWKNTVRLDKIRTATMAGIDGEMSYPLLWVTLDGGAGEQNLLHAFPKVLISELRALKPNVGDVFTIEYQGEKKTKGGFKARIFEITAADGVESNIDWDNAPF
jgi:hypothetical protein